MCVPASVRVYMYLWVCIVGVCMLFNRRTQIGHARVCFEGLLRAKLINYVDATANLWLVGMAYGIYPPPPLDPLTIYICVCKRKYLSDAC